MDWFTAIPCFVRQVGKTPEIIKQLFLCLFFNRFDGKVCKPSSKFIATRPIYGRIANGQRESMRDWSVHLWSAGFTRIVSPLADDTLAVKVPSFAPCP